MLSHWKCTGNMTDQNGFWSAKCWNWSENGWWPTVISNINLLYTIVEKQPYLMSTSSYKLSVKSILPHVCPILMVFTETKWQIIMKCCVTVILDNLMMWSSSLCKEWFLLCITNLFISKESLLYKLSFCS